MNIHKILIPLVTVAATGYYTYIGQMVPQKEVHPPKMVKLGKEMTTEDMVKAGETIFNGKGTCTACHKLTGGTGRFPDLGQVGATAGSRKDGMSDIEYLAESLYKPNDFIVKGFNAGMPPVDRAPIGLTDIEIKATIAYLQSLGGTPSITMDTKLKWETGDSEQSSAEPAKVGPKKALSPQEVLTNFACLTCHQIDAPGNLVGPSLFDIGNKLDKAALTEALLEPDKTIAKGFPAGVMGATLEGSGFYQKVSTKELKELVDFLSNKKGK